MSKLTVTLGEGEVLLDRLLEHGAAVGHECGGTLACATCRVIVREGLERLSPASEDELDMLERSGIDAPGARLACQVSGTGAVLVEIPREEAPSHDGLLPVTASEQAARFLSRQLAKQPGAVAVRLRVEPAGCSGFGYRVDHVHEIGESDLVFESHGIRIVVDPASLPYVQGTTVELVQEGLARRMRFDNPNVRRSCGCGESFSA